MLYLFISCFLLVSCANSFEIVNDRPIIGVVVEDVFSSKIVPNATSQIYASYIKFLESAGARVVPIWIHKPVSYYQDLLSKINGVLFPGGGNILQSDGYGRTGKIIFDIAIQMNDKGNYFPLWGTCLGFELLNLLVSKRLWMKSCAAEDLATNLEFTKEYKNSRIFKDLDTKLENSMRNKDVVIHYHQWCLTPQNYSTSGLDKYFKVVAVNQDRQNITFVSVVEAYKYPFYGVAFHPEKIAFEWMITKSQKNKPHSSEAIKVSQYFGNFFVDEARKNINSFPSVTEENKALIYNYNPVFTGKLQNSVVQKYYFT